MYSIRLYFSFILTVLIAPIVFGQDSTSVLNDAQELYDNQQYESVIAILDSVNEPELLGQIEMLKGDAQHKLGHFQLAIRNYDAAEKAKLNTLELFFHRGAALISIGNYTKASKDLSKAISIDKEYADLYFYRAYAYTELFKYEKAIADYSTAIIINPNYAAAYYNRGAVRVDMGLLELGESDFEEASRFGQGSLDVSFNLAIIAYEKQEYEKAINMLEELLDTQDINQKIDAYYYLGECNYQLDETEASCEYFKEAMQLGDSYSEEIYYNYCEKGKLRKTIKERRKTNKITF